MKVPEVVSELAKKIEAADGVIIATQSTTTHSSGPAKRACLAVLRHLPMVIKPVMTSAHPWAHSDLSRAQLRPSV